MHLDIRNPGKQAELANNFRAAQEWIIPPSEIQPLPSSHIPVPRNRYEVADDIKASTPLVYLLDSFQNNFCVHGSYFYSALMELIWHRTCGEKKSYTRFQAFLDRVLTKSGIQLLAKTVHWFWIGIGMNGAGVYWSTDHMFGVLSRIVSKYALREPELEMKARIAQSLGKSSKRTR